LHGQVIEGPAMTRSVSVARLAGMGEVLVSRPVHDLVAGAGLAFTPREDMRTGDGQAWPTYAVDPASLRP
jgi:hypothetical protein